MSARLPGTLEEHLAKMADIAESALRTINRRARPADSRQRAWWEGYRQATEEVGQFTSLPGHPSLGDGDGGGGG